MPYLPMYEAAYGLVAALARVKNRALAPTQQQIGLLVTNLSLIRTGTRIKLDRARLRSIALGEHQKDIKDNLHYKQLDKTLGEIFNGNI